MERECYHTKPKNFSSHCIQVQFERIVRFDAFYYGPFHVVAMLMRALISCLFVVITVLARCLFQWCFFENLIAYLSLLCMWHCGGLFPLLWTVFRFVGKGQQPKNYIYIYSGASRSTCWDRLPRRFQTLWRDDNPKKTAQENEKTHWENEILTPQKCNLYSRYFSSFGVISATTIYTLFAHLSFNKCI